MVRTSKIITTMTCFTFSGQLNVVTNLGMSGFGFINFDQFSFVCLFCSHSAVLRNHSWRRLKWYLGANYGWLCDIKLPFLTYYLFDTKSIFFLNLSSGFENGILLMWNL